MCIVHFGFERWKYGTRKICKKQSLHHIQRIHLFEVLSTHLSNNLLQDFVSQCLPLALWFEKLLVGFQQHCVLGNQPFIHFHAHIFFIETHCLIKLSSTLV